MKTERMRTGRIETVTTPNLRPQFSDWLEGARLRTLPAALAPVLAGTGAAGPEAKLGRALLAAAVALALQIGVNFANDYSDGVRGTDEHRVGPTRLTASGIVAPATVKRIAFAWFGAAAVAGLVLVALAQAWWLIGAGALAIIAAWFYTGGKNPYGYRGLGEVAVFVFFGLVATWGTTYTQTLTLNLASVLAGTSMGFIACALLMINNIRDIATDTVSGKRTLAVRLGDRRARRMYGLFMLLTLGFAIGAFVALGSFLDGVTFTTGAGLLGLVFGAWALLLAARVLRSRAEMIPTLRDTGLVQLGIGVSLLLAGLL